MSTRPAPITEAQALALFQEAIFVKATTLAEFATQYEREQCACMVESISPDIAAQIRARSVRVIH